MRYLKRFGFAVTAILAVSAITASGASATNPGAITPTEGTTMLHTTQVGANSFTLDGTEFTCATGTSGDVTISGPMTEIESTPAVSGCKTSGGQFVTLTTNQCKILAYHMTTTAPSHWSATGQFKCPAGKEIEVHVYLFSNHTFSVCTLSMGSQTSNKANITVSNHGTGTTSSVSAVGKIEGVTVTRVSGCNAPAGLVHTGVLHINATVTGQNHEGAHRGIHVG